MWLFIVLSCLRISIAIATVSKSSSSISVMIVGNSLTYTGDVPSRLADLLQLALPPGAKVKVEDYALSSTNLSISSDAMMDPKSTLYRLIRQPWDVVVLQEQSQLPGRWLVETSTNPGNDLVISQLDELYSLVNIPLPAALSTSSSGDRQDFQWLVRTMSHVPSTPNTNNPVAFPDEPCSCADTGGGSSVAVQSPSAAVCHLGLLARGPHEPGPVSRLCNDACTNHPWLLGVCSTGLLHHGVIPCTTHIFHLHSCSSWT